MKMTWLHIKFVLIFLTDPSRVKLNRMARQQLLTHASLLCPYSNKREGADY